MTTRDKNESEYVHELVCQLFCEGKHPSEIAKWIEDHCGIVISQKDPYRILHAEHSNFQFISPRHNALSEGVKAAFAPTYGRKLEVTVTLTDLHEDLVRRGATAIWDIILHRVNDPQVSQREFKIGCSGGHTLKGIAVRLRNILRQPWNPNFIPDKIVFKALVTGIDTEAAGTDPTSFFTYLSEDKEEGISLSCKTGFELFNAAPLVRPIDHERLRRTGESSRPSITEAFRRDRHCDIIVTSAAEFEDPHSQLRMCYERYSKPTLESLREANCIGDLLWQPLNDYGPIDTSDHPFRTLTLIDLPDLPSLIRNGTRVVLVLGPCVGGCSRLRTRLLYVVLRHKLVTDVVLSRQTAQDLLHLDRRIRELRTEIDGMNLPDAAQHLNGKQIDPTEQLLILSDAPALKTK